MTEPAQQQFQIHLLGLLNELTQAREAVRKLINKGKLALPGGYIGLGESWQEAGAREAREGTGISISPGEIREFRVRNAPDGTLLIFGLAQSRTLSALLPFVPNEEVTERVILTAPVEMAFPLHTDVARHFFNLHFRSTLLAGNTAFGIWEAKGLDCYGVLTSQGHNLVQNISDCTIVGDTTGNIISRTAFLLPLQDNGGSTLTHALWFISPAIDAGDPAYCPSTDQRGMSRPTDGNDDGVAVCDIGAYEGAIPPASRSHLPIIWK